MLELGMCEICGVRGISETLGTVMCLRDGKQVVYKGDVEYGVCLLNRSTCEIC